MAYGGGWTKVEHKLRSATAGPHDIRNVEDLLPKHILGRRHLLAAHDDGSESIQSLEDEECRCCISASTIVKTFQSA